MKALSQQSLQAHAGWENVTGLPREGWKVSQRQDVEMQVGQGDIAM